ncbi:ABC transporter substrate-binding protein [Pelagibius sp.]|uniref:ABC transporter substrate-binding protein n=1 Tax=Pelagibius sp. TaxID=1931238 RepID=UPI002633EABD|nr:ABC transporter substrate-binding protein [Pelagibius sp.]
MRTGIFASVTCALALTSSLAYGAGTTLNIGMASADAGKLDPHVATTTPDKGLLHWMFNGLVRIKPGQASPAFIEADLAESWEASDDGLVWTFNLRQGVQCHGEYGELDANDVVFSLKRAANNDTSGFANDFKAFSSIEATGDYEVKITLSEPVPSLLGLLVPYHGGNIVCQDAVEALGDQFQRSPIGTGPFMFAEYQPQQYVKLVANEDYFRGAPKIKEIYYRYIPSDASRDLAFQSGEIDMIYGKQDQTWVERIKGVPGTTVTVMEPGEMSVIHLNMTMPPLDNKLVRQAVAHAIDRNAMVQFKGESVTRGAVSPVPEGYLGYTNEVPTYDYNVDKAKELLAQAGFADGVTLKAIHTTLPGMLTTIEAVQALLKQANINLEIEPVEHATFHQRIREDASQVVHYSAARFPIADVYLTQFYHSDSIVATPSAITNFSHCAVADGEIEAARVEQNAAEQKLLWAKAQQKIMEEVCSVPIYQNLQLWAWKDNLDLGVEVKGSLNLSPPITELAGFTN